jgi:predicted nucleic acid-binding protein
MSNICIDANIWLKLLVPEPDSLLAEQLIRHFLNERRSFVAPSVLPLEVGSILRKKVGRKLISSDTADELWNKFRSLPILYFDPLQLMDRAWSIAHNYRLPNLYDALYVAAAEGIEFWTADERLVNSLEGCNSAAVRLLKRDLPMT